MTTRTDTIGSTTSSTELIANTQIGAWGPLTASGSGILQSIGINVHITGSENIYLMLYADNGGTPVGGALVAQTGQVTMPSGFGDFTTTTHPSIIGGGKYWLSFEPSGIGHTIYYATSGTLYYTNEAYGTIPNPYPSSSTSAGETVNMRITYTLSTVGVIINSQILTRNPIGF